MDNFTNISQILFTNINKYIIYQDSHVIYPYSVCHSNHSLTLWRNIWQPQWLQNITPSTVVQTEHYVFHWGPDRTLPLPLWSRQNIITSSTVVQTEHYVFHWGPDRTLPLPLWSRQNIITSSTGVQTEHYLFHWGSDRTLPLPLVSRQNITSCKT